MSEPFLAEIRVFSFGFAPRGWAQCNGQLLPIRQNQALFALLGTMYGGDGRTTFALPDLRGRVPAHASIPVMTLGERGGEEQHTLTAAELPAHTHALQASTRKANSPSPTLLAATANAYGAATNLTPLGAAEPNGPSIGPVAGGAAQPHDNMMPYAVINFCIALIGIFPSRS